MNIDNSDYKLFQKNYVSGKKQLLFLSFPADVHTPVSAILKLKNEKYTFLFESVEKGSQKGRYSVIGLKPDIIWECKDNKCYYRNLNNSNKIQIIKQNPLKSLKKLMSENKLVLPTQIPSISTGLFGYMGYEMIQFFENIDLKKKNHLNLPDSIFIRPSITLVFDNVNDRLLITKLVCKNSLKPKEAFDKAKNDIHKILNKINKPLPKENFNSFDRKEKINVFKNVKSNTNFKEFKIMVNKAKKYILEGEIFQVVLSRIFKKKIETDSLSIYRALRYLNPSPYLFFMNFNHFTIVGSSPEILIKLENKKVTIRPIAGTRKRGKTNREDENLKKDLLNDPKEISEHLMLLDLGRNDISRVTKPGTVRVTDQMYIEYFSHVMHIVSNIEGFIEKNKQQTDVLYSGFPAGTVTGAPKIRAIEIIDQLEKNRRNVYAGSVGYISANGDIDTCIALRTALIKDQYIYIQSGAGIVADSKPMNEFKETENKALALLTACEQARNFK
ncbi:MAG: anthranilate synthase component I [Alphaproteobacteria bacterium]